MLQVLTYILLVSLASATSQPNETFYKVLRDNGLPIGLVPKAIRGFQMDDLGCFELRLEAPCNAKFENEVHYDTNVSGSISFGQIGDLGGVSAQELFLWLPVKGIRVDVPSSGVIYFDVGAVRKQFQLSLFDTPPDCQEEEDVVGAVVEDTNVKLQHFAGTDVAEKAIM